MAVQRAQKKVLQSAILMAPKTAEPMAAGLVPTTAELMVLQMAPYLAILLARLMAAAKARRMGLTLGLRMVLPRQRGLVQKKESCLESPKLPAMARSLVQS